MIKHKLIDKGSIAHALITPSNKPTYFIPVKVVIKDVKFDEYNPYYLVKIIKFYDNVYFLREHFMNNKFSNGFGKKPRHFYINQSEINTVEKLQNYIEKEDSRFYVVVDSVHTTRYRNDMMTMFNRMQDFLIYRNIQELSEMTTRSSYKGDMRIDTRFEFFNRLKRMLSDIVVDIGMTWDDFKNRF